MAKRLPFSHRYLICTVSNGVVKECVSPSDATVRGVEHIIGGIRLLSCQGSSSIYVKPNDEWVLIPYERAFHQKVVEEFKEFWGLYAIKKHAAGVALSSPLDATNTECAFALVSTLRSEGVRQVEVLGFTKKISSGLYDTQTGAAIVFKDGSVFNGKDNPGLVPDKIQKSMALLGDVARSMESFCIAEFGRKIFEAGRKEKVGFVRSMTLDDEGKWTVFDHTFGDGSATAGSSVIEIEDIGKGGFEFNNDPRLPISHVSHEICNTYRKRGDNTKRQPRLKMKSMWPKPSWG